MVRIALHWVWRPAGAHWHSHFIQELIARMKLMALHGHPVLIPILSGMGTVRALPHITWM